MHKQKPRSIQSVAIIGAGLAGAVVAQRLLAAGIAVTVFEKSRGTGGRLASARLGEFSADLGAPAIDAKSEDFLSWLKMQQQLGRLLEWTPRAKDFSDNPVQVEPLWIGKGRNSSLTRELMEGARLVTQTRIGVVWPDKEGVLLRDEGGAQLGHFDAVICTAPAPQAVRLLEAVPRFAAIADSAVTDPSWVYLAALERLPHRLEGVDMVVGEHPGFAKLTVDSNKPGRGGIVLKVEMHRDWSEQRINESPEAIKESIRAQLRAWLEGSFEPVDERVHRWLYNCSYQPSFDQYSLWDAETGIGACGDWIGPSGLNGSYLSAQQLADQLLESGQSAA